MTELTPQEIPPSEEAAMTEPELQEIPASEEAAMAEAAAAMPSEMPLEEALAMPLEMPPEVEEAVSEAFGVTWHTGKKITSLWSIDENRNSWIGVPGLGWKKLANNSDSAVVALTMLASHAKLTGRNVDIKEDSGQITEMYVW